MFAVKKNIFTISLEFIKLLKLRLSASVIFSALAGYLLAIDQSNPHNLLILIKLLIGGFGVVACANGLNQVFEVDTDALMDRTKNRPLPKKTITLTVALIFSLFLGIFGLGVLFLINLKCVLYSLVSLLIYVLGYTPMKSSGPFAGFIGAIPGAMPIMLGWLALRDEFGWEPGIFFAIQFIWQFPHFWSIAWIRFDDYKKAGINLLPSRRKDHKTVFQMCFYTFLLIPLTIIPFIYKESLNNLSLTGSILVFLMGIWFFIISLGFLRKRSDLYAKKMMIFSVIYLPTVQLIYILDNHNLLYEIKI